MRIYKAYGATQQEISVSRAWDKLSSAEVLAQEGIAVADLLYGTLPSDTWDALLKRMRELERNAENCD